MRFKNWVNQYIPLIDTKPAYILTCKEGELNSQESDLIKEKMKIFSKVYCELGSGSGQHLTQRASYEENALFAGFELRFKRIFKTAEKAERMKLNNLLVLRLDARQIAAVFPAESIDGVYINFPDPWSDKKKWSKHKLFNSDLLKALAKILKPQGFISYKTDHAQCFEENHKLLIDSGLFTVQSVSHDLHGSQYQVTNVETEFERLFLSKGQPIYFLHSLRNY